MDCNSEDESLTPPNILKIASDAESLLIPEKSRDKYESSYNLFMKWRESNHCQSSFSENIVLAYFSEKCNVWKPSTLWAQYSMLRSMMNINHNVDISSYKKLIAFLKSKSKEFQSKKSKVFTSQEVNQFLTNAPDSEYLAAKVILIFGISGACRSCELTNVTVKDMKTEGNIYLVNIPKTKNSVPRIFAITAEFANIVNKYAALRPTHAQTDRFFLNYQKGKCSAQVIGINKFAKTPQKIAEFLNLESPELYTRHSFRKTSATLLVDAGGDMDDLKRHGGWKTATVAEGYVENSISNKNKIAQKIASSVAMPSTNKNSKRLKLDVFTDNSNTSTSQIEFKNLSNTKLKLLSNQGTTISISDCTNCTITFEK